MRSASIRAILGSERIEKLQGIIWIRVRFNYFIRNLNDFLITNPKVPCDFIPIIMENCHRVRDFRENERMVEYQAKLVRGEIGFFAEHEGRMVGSVWATINKARIPMLVRNYITIGPGHALIIDGVTGEKARGLGVGSFMISRMAKVLLEEHGVAEITLDVNTKKQASIRMMEKIGLRKEEKVLYLTLGQGRAFRLLLRKYVK